MTKNETRYEELFWQLNGGEKKFWRRGLGLIVCRVGGREGPVGQLTSLSGEADAG